MCRGRRRAHGRARRWCREARPDAGDVQRRRSQPAATPQMRVRRKGSAQSGESISHAAPLRRARPPARACGQGGVCEYSAVLTELPLMENGDVGEAQAKKLSHKQLLQRFSYCVYCGGVEQATSVDHMPPRMMFRGKFRPSGLEFPACDGCNQGTKHADLVASLLGRLYPDCGTELGANDFRKILSAV